MQQMERTLTSDNIDSIINDLYVSLSSLGESIKGKVGVQLFTALKREKLIGGPYPGVTLFEAANRVMSDLVILHGVAGLLKAHVFPFTAYTVEFGNEDNNGFDIRASSSNCDLVGEAFNVAPSFFQGKKGTALKKLRDKAASAKIRLVMFNDDAVTAAYSPTLEEGIHYVFVNIETGSIRVEPLPTLQ
jgi:hypothetical protein